MAWDQEADAEEGDLSDWDATGGAGTGVIVASEAAAYNGNYGWAITVDGVGNDAFGVLQDPADETEVIILLYLHPNSITMAVNDSFHLVRGTGSGAVNIGPLIVFGRNASGYFVQGGTVNDGWGAHLSSEYTIDDDWHLLVLYWKAATGAGANDGIVIFVVDGESIYTLKTIDSDTIDVDDVLYGCPLAIDAGTSGTFYMDDCKWSNEAGTFDTPDVARAISQVVVPTVRIREIVADPVRAIAQVDPGTTRIREIVANVTRAIAQVSALGTHQSFVTKILHALFKRYTFLAPEHIEIENNKGVAIAPHRRYELIAEKRETD